MTDQFNIQSLPRFSSLLIIFALGPVANAAPIIDSTSKAEINWSTMKIRLIGEAKFDDTNVQESLKKIEQAAWQDGIQNATPEISKVFQTRPDLEKELPSASVAAKRAVDGILSHNTTYYAHGRVRVELENSLASALVPEHLTFKTAAEPNVAALAYSGVVFKVSGNMKPRAAYTIKDETGAILFAPSDVAEVAFKKNLMGKWFRRPNQFEVSSAIGANPLTVAATTGADGSLVVSKADWQKVADGNLALLQASQIVISLSK